MKDLKDMTLAEVKAICKEHELDCAGCPFELYSLVCYRLPCAWDLGEDDDEGRR